MLAGRKIICVEQNINVEEHRGTNLEISSVTVGVAECSGKCNRYREGEPVDRTERESRWAGGPVPVPSAEWRLLFLFFDSELSLVWDPRAEHRGCSVENPTCCLPCPRANPTLLLERTRTFHFTSYITADWKTLHESVCVSSLRERWAEQSVSVGTDCDQWSAHID